MRIMERLSQQQISPAPAPPTTDELLISNLCEILRSYLSEQEVSDIYKAYLFGAEAHSNQKRLSGEPYIYHSIEVARIMAELQLDPVTISAGLLHDVIEDTGVSKAQLAKKFSKEVAEVVDGVSKLDSFAFESKEAKQAKNFQKMMLAVAKDVRVILVKLADRLHNMRTIEPMPLHKQKSIARETLEIYAPLAQRVGIERLGVELEDLSFRTLYPLRYQVLNNAIESYLGQKGKLFDEVIKKVRNHFKRVGIECQVQGRKKPIYSIYSKMKEKRQPLSKIADIFAVRLIVDSVDNCYRALGIMHGFSKPVPGRFKDYIALPKSNGYQSLHTVLFGPKGIRMEVQIRTQEMDRIAETGIAAHPLYKVKEEMNSAARAMKWLQSLIRLDQDMDDAAGYMKNLRAELSPDEIYLFTPNGEIVELPRKSTALDFAFAIHTDVGLSTTAVRVDERVQPLSFRLRSGQTVEVFTSDDKCATPKWLGFVITAKARHAIHQYLKHIQQGEAIQLGKHLLEEALNKSKTSLSDIAKERIDKVIAFVGEKDLDGLYSQIGMGSQVPQLIAARLLGESDIGQPLAFTLGKTLTGSMTDKAMQGMVISYAKCCHPLPGDAIIAMTSAERGLVVHRNACPNVSASFENKNTLVHLQWANETAPDEEYSAEIKVVTSHKRGALASIASEIAQYGSNIESISFEEKPSQSLATIRFIISIKSKRALEDLMKQIERSVADTKVYRAGLKTDGPLQNGGGGG